MPISHSPCRRRYIGPLPSCFILYCKELNKSWVNLCRPLSFHPHPLSPLARQEQPPFSIIALKCHAKFSTCFPKVSPLAVLLVAPWTAWNPEYVTSGDFHLWQPQISLSLPQSNGLLFCHKEQWRNKRSMIKIAEAIFCRAGIACSSSVF